MQHLTLRGIQESRLKSTKQKDLPAYHCETVKDMLEFYLSCTTYATASHVTALNKPLPTRNPFPDIFDEWIGVDGNVNAIARTEHTSKLLCGLNVSCFYGQFCRGGQCASFSRFPDR